MFLSDPTVQELEALDLPALMEMLRVQTVSYTRLLNQEGFSADTLSQGILLRKLQEAISKKKARGLRPQTD